MGELTLQWTLCGGVCGCVGGYCVKPAAPSVLFRPPPLAVTPTVLPGVVVMLCGAVLTMHGGMSVRGCVSWHSRSGFERAARLESEIRRWTEESGTQGVWVRMEEEDVAGQRQVRSVCTEPHGRRGRGLERSLPPSLLTHVLSQSLRRPKMPGGRDASAVLPPHTIAHKMRGFR